MFFAVMTGVSLLDASAQQQPEKPDLNVMAEEEADKLQKLLDLEDWQVFYVDSTLKANYAALQLEFENLQKAKVTNTAIYQEAQDKFWDSVEASYKKYFTDKQWALYLKNGAAKAQKQRAKRRENKK
jgi:hypothetical protein